MSIVTIEKNGDALARLIQSDNWEVGLSFYSLDSEFIQVGSWSYNKGKELSRHIHNEVERTVMRTQEVLYIRKGSIEAQIYDLDGAPVDILVASEGDVLILLNSGHGYKILEDGTQVLEVKNGPYLGADIDRKRF